MGETYSPPFFTGLHREIQRSHPVRAPKRGTKALEKCACENSVSATVNVSATSGAVRLLAGFIAEPGARPACDRTHSAVIGLTCPMDPQLLNLEYRTYLG